MCAHASPQFAADAVCAFVAQGQYWDAISPRRILASIEHHLSLAQCATSDMIVSDLWYGRSSCLRWVECQSRRNRKLFQHRLVALINIFGASPVGKGHCNSPLSSAIVKPLSSQKNSTNTARSA